jgi:hypothetical protein
MMMEVNGRRTVYGYVVDLVCTGCFMDHFALLSTEQ